MNDLMQLDVGAFSKTQRNSTNHFTDPFPPTLSLTTKHNPMSEKRTLNIYLKLRQ